MKEQELKDHIMRIIEAQCIPRWTLSDVARAAGINIWTLRAWLTTPGAGMRAENKRKIRAFVRKERTKS